MRRMRQLGTRASAGLTAVAALAILLAGAGAAPAGEPDAAGAVGLPPPPALYTVGVSRVKVVEPDTLTVSRGLQKPLTLRLADAACASLEKDARERGVALVTQLLEPEPFWIFPVCREKDGPETAWRADVWTKKGWLSEVLIKAHLATRRPDPYDGAALPREKVELAKDTPPPCAPAFRGVVSRAIDGDSFEVLRDGKTLKVRLFDVSCESGSAEDANALATRLVGTDRVWIFPSSQRRVAATEEMPVRIWTKDGWLSQAMVKASLAKVLPDPDKAAETAVAAKPEKDPTPPKTPSTQDFVWREIPVGQVASNDHLQCQSSVFTVPSSDWRVTWNMTPVRTGAVILINLYRVDENWATKTSSTYITSLKGPTGSQMLRTKPGDFWFRAIQSNKLGIKVEVKEYLDKSK